MLDGEDRAFLALTSRRTAYNTTQLAPSLSRTYRPIGKPSGFAEQYEFLEQKHLSQALLAFALPHEKFVLPQQSALLLQVNVTLPERVHGQQIVTMPQLEPDHALGLPQVLRVAFGHLH